MPARSLRLGLLGLITLSLALGGLACRPQSESPATPAASPSPAARQARVESPSPAASTPTPVPTATPFVPQVASPAASPRVVVPPGPRYTAKLHHQSATTESRHFLAQKLAEIADARSNGRLKIEITPAGQVYHGEAEYQALARNDIQLALPRLAELTTFDPIWTVIDLPFLLSPEAAAKLGHEAPGRTLWKSLEPHGIAGLALINLHDPVILYTQDRPILTLDDLRGLRVRSYLASPELHNEWLRIFGANAISLPGSEVYPAIQRGQIDSVLTTISAARELRLPEVVRYGNLIPVSSVPLGFAASARWLNAIPREIRQMLIEDVIPEAEAAFAAYQIALVADSRDKAARNGIEFIQPPAEVAEAMKRRTEAELYPRLAGNYPGELVREIQDLQ
ncbi:MAG TPA: TRAP transporter substrate-binding protein DctP [Dehalococcoidia bacterium]|nr:TRAP transporter substrate-binding protein DctP [Dehalococcoidia bacterium]